MIGFSGGIRDHLYGTFGEEFRRLKRLLGWKLLVFLIGILIALVACFLFVPISTLWLDNLMFDIYQKLICGLRSPNQDLLVVGIDSRTLDSTPHRWPWPRGVLAGIISKVAEGCPKAILIDIVLQHNDLHADGPFQDATLVESLKSVGNVCLVSVVSHSIGCSGMRLMVQKSHEEFRKSALLEGFVWSPVCTDGKLRESILFSHQLNIMSFVMKVALHLNPELASVYHAHQNHDLSTMVAFSTAKGGIPVVSVSDIMAEGFPVEVLKGKIVLIGATAPILHDFHLTSIGVVSGPEILCYLLDTVLSKRVVKRNKSILLRILLGMTGFLLALLLSINAKRYALWIRLFSIPPVSIFMFFSLASSGHFMPVGVMSCTWIVTSLAIALERSFLGFVDNQITLTESIAAGNIQRQLFPKPFLKLEDGSKIQGFCLTCSHAGGDYFDYHVREDGSLMFILGDVSGHGLASAMITVAAKTIVQTTWDHKELDLLHISEKLNAFLLNLFSKKKFLTAQSGLFFPHENRIKFHSVGHVPAILRRYDGTMEFFSWPSRPLGMVGGKAKFQAIDIPFFPGDSFVMYTDGLIEAVGPQGSVFGFDRWNDNVRKHLPRADGNLEILLNEVREFMGRDDFDDDVTVVLLSRPMISTERLEEDARQHEEPPVGHCERV